MRVFHRCPLSGWGEFLLFLVFWEFPSWMDFEFVECLFFVFTEVMVWFLSFSLLMWWITQICLNVEPILHSWGKYHWIVKWYCSRPGDVSPWPPTKAHSAEADSEGAERGCCLLTSFPTDGQHFPKGNSNGQQNMCSAFGWG